MQRANVLIKQGLYDDAEADYRFIVSNQTIDLNYYNSIINVLKLKTDSNNDEVIQRVETIKNLRSDINRSKMSMQNRDFNSAIELFTKVLEVNNSSFFFQYNHHSNTFFSF
jgi:hypothetical protein